MMLMNDDDDGDDNGDSDDDVDCDADGHDDDGFDDDDDHDDVLFFFKNTQMMRYVFDCRNAKQNIFTYSCSTALSLFVVYFLGFS